MIRRVFIAGLGSAAAWPVVARAQQIDGMRRVGILINTAEDDPIGQARLAAFRQSLEDLGWREGRNVRFVYRWAGGDIGRMHAYAAELVGLMPNVILANTTPAAAALKQETRSIPIVFAVVNDPVEQGLVSNLAHPGENITGFSYLEFSVVGAPARRPAASQHSWATAREPGPLESRGPIRIRSCLLHLRHCLAEYSVQKLGTHQFVNCSPNSPRSSRPSRFSRCPSTGAGFWRGS